MTRPWHVGTVMGVLFVRSSDVLRADDRCHRSSRARHSNNLLLVLEQVADVGKQLFLSGASGSLGLFLLGHELVHGLDHQEDTEGDDDKVDDVLDEHTILERSSSDGLTTIYGG